MNEQAGHLVDRALPQAPYRQQALTLPCDLAHTIAFDAGLCAQVFAVFADEVAGWQRARAESAGITRPQAGSVLEIQRFADGARLWPHGHLLAPDGVFYEANNGRVRFHGPGPPRDRDIRTMVTRVAERVVRHLKRRASRSVGDEDLGGLDPRQLLLQLAATPAHARIAVKGSGGSGPPNPARRARTPLCARTPEGFELHAGVRVRASDRTGLVETCPGAWSRPTRRKPAPKRISSDS